MADETRTQSNVVAAYRAESRRKNTYLACAGSCDRGGNPQLAKLFRAAAASEDVHVQSLLKVLSDFPNLVQEARREELAVEPVSDSIAENLRQAINRETDQITDFPQAIQQAETDGWQAASDCFRHLSAVARIHAAFFKEALDQLGRNAPADYNICQRCGNIIERRPAGPCEVCDAPDTSFQSVT